MSVGEQEMMPLLRREIPAFLKQARTTRPLHHPEALVDLDQPPGCADVPLPERLARAMAAWDGRLIPTATDDGLAPGIRRGDRLAIDPAADPRDGARVVAFVGGALLIRRWWVRAGGS